MKPRLITVPISIYCEKARWALERAGIAFNEEMHLQGFHFPSVFRASGGDTVPVLVTDEETLADSSLILEWVDRRGGTLYDDDEEGGKVEELEEYLDESLGPATRLWMYSYLIHEYSIISFSARMHAVPRRERWMSRLLLPIQKRVLTRVFGLKPTSREESVAKVDAIFDEIGKKIGGKNYLLGNEFTAADLTFAALSAVALWPPQYGVELPPFEELPESMRAQITKWREHPAGRFAMELYRTERRRAASV
jgi:glutathione S-transferase